MVTEITCPQNQHPSCLPLLIRQLHFLLLIHIHHLAGERASFLATNQGHHRLTQRL